MTPETLIGLGRFDLLKAWLRECEFEAEEAASIVSDVRSVFFASGPEEALGFFTRILLSKG